MMAQLVYFKEWLTTLYKRHVEIILPILKLLFAFFALSMFQRMFYYNEFIDKPWVFLAVSGFFTNIVFVLCDIYIDYDKSVECFHGYFSGICNFLYHLFPCIYTSR